MKTHHVDSDPDSTACCGDMGHISGTVNNPEDCLRLDNNINPSEKPGQLMKQLSQP